MRAAIISVHGDVHQAVARLQISGPMG